MMCDNSFLIQLPSQLLSLNVLNLSHLIVTVNLTVICVSAVHLSSVMLSHVHYAKRRRPVSMRVLFLELRLFLQLLSPSVGQTTTSPPPALRRAVTGVHANGLLMEGSVFLLGLPVSPYATVSMIII